LLDPSLPEPHYQLGVLFSQKGKPQEALTELKTAANQDPSASKIHFALSNAYRRTGDREKVAEEMKIFEDLKKNEDSRGGKMPPQK
jgi:protein O-GlcNAc transferase